MHVSKFRASVQIRGGEQRTRTRALDETKLILVVG